MTYQHRNTQYTLFYRIPSWRESYWAIAATNQLTAQNPLLNGKVYSVVMCPEQITETEWSVYYYGWTSSYIQIQCLSGTSSGAPEFIPDADISGLNDTDSSLFNYEGVYAHTTPKKAQLANDPRDMFFVLPNFNQLWYSQSTGSSIYSSNYEGGIFTTDEGYQFELQIFFKELDKNLIKSTISIRPSSLLSYLKSHNLCFWSQNLISKFGIKICKGINNQPWGKAGLTLANYTSIIPIPYANEYDQSNVWPLTGKQITFGIVELGFCSISY